MSTNSIALPLLNYIVSNLGSSSTQTDTGLNDNDALSIFSSLLNPDSENSELSNSEDFSTGLQLGLALFSLLSGNSSTAQQTTAQTQTANTGNYGLFSGSSDLGSLLNANISVPSSTSTSTFDANQSFSQLLNSGTNTSSNYSMPNMNLSGYSGLYDKSGWDMMTQGAQDSISNVLSWKIPTIPTT